MLLLLIICGERADKTNDRKKDNLFKNNNNSRTTNSTVRWTKNSSNTVRYDTIQSSRQGGRRYFAFA